MYVEYSKVISAVLKLLAISNFQK